MWPKVQPLQAPQTLQLHWCCYRAFAHSLLQKSRVLAAWDAQGMYLDPQVPWPEVLRLKQTACQAFEPETLATVCNFQPRTCEAQALTAPPHALMTCWSTGCATWIELPRLNGGKPVTVRYTLAFWLAVSVVRSLLWIPFCAVWSIYRRSQKAGV